MPLRQGQDQCGSEPSSPADFLLSWLFWMALTIHKSSEPTKLGRYSFTYCVLFIGVATAVIVSLLAQVTFFYMRIHKARGEIILVAHRFSSRWQFGYLILWVFLTFVRRRDINWICFRILSSVISMRPTFGDYIKESLFPSTS